MTDLHMKHISQYIEWQSVVETVIICPGCNRKSIIGGERSYDEIEDRPIIMMFGREINEDDYKLRLHQFVGQIMKNEGV
jgi:hypothetical protein